MDIEKYKKAWQMFQEKMSGLRKRQTEIIKRINEKLDKQRIEKIKRQMEDEN